MASVLVLYKTPKDTTAFDKHYFETHIPLERDEITFGHSLSLRSSLSTRQV